MKKIYSKTFLFSFLLVTLSLFIISAALFFGSSFVPFRDFFTENGAISPIILSRIYRIAAAFFAGGSLALSGSCYQAVLRNPLAEPYILGVSSGAALGTALAFITKAAQVSIYILPAFAAAGGVAAIFLVLLPSLFRKGDNTTLLLSGVITGTVFSSILMALITFAGTQEISSVTWFLLGDLSSSDPLLLRFFMVISIILVLLLILLSPKANALMLGDDYARSMGIEPLKTSILLLFLASLLTAGSVALTGIIGFAGLIVPHILRKCGFSDNRKLFPLSFYGGGLFLVFCDLLSRSIFTAREIPIGVITAFLGGILFLRLLYNNNNKEGSL